MPRGPEARGSVDYEKYQGLDTLAGGTPICMYRHFPKESLNYRSKSNIIPDLMA
jgi:hypothetical protein